MKTLEVVSPGMLTTVQDLGRVGYGPLGVSRSGAADPTALRLGNLLVGNSQGAAALEMTLLGGAFAFPEGGVVALTGSDFGATLEGRSVPLNTSAHVDGGQTLHIGATRSGARCYLSVQGGIRVAPFLGSASTHLLTGLGGYQGRALRKGDVLKTGDFEGKFVDRTIAPAALKQLLPRKTLRVTAGPQIGWFTKAAVGAFFKSIYRAGERSDRMGIRLEGEPVPVRHGGDMISEGVSNGAVQIPAGGLPIILFVEQQTTGGYPKIANVITADLSSLGQLRPRDEIQFARVSREAARASLLKQERLLASNDLIVEAR